MTVLIWREDEIAMTREALLTSVREAREQLEDPDQLVVVGYGLGAVAAASLAIHAKRLGITLKRAICIQPDWSQLDPISEQLVDMTKARSEALVLDSEPSSDELAELVG